MTVVHYEFMMSNTHSKLKQNTDQLALTLVKYLESFVKVRASVEGQLLNILI